MAIRVDCGACQAAFSVKDEYAGKRGKCPQCKAAVMVPQAETLASPAAAPEDDEGYALADAPRKVRAVPVRKAAASAPRTELPGLASEAPWDEGASAAAAASAREPTRSALEILAGFRGEIQAVRPTLGYRLWILIVAGVMVVLPMIYVGLVALVGYAVYLHAVHDVAVFGAVRNVKAALAIYVGPLAVGVIVVGFMLKPLFAPPARRRKTKKLDPSTEPLVFAFVDGVCKSVGSPRPARIEVDCMVNASAALVGGRLEWLTGELVLTIGLPLVAGLSLKGFAGVLAHEFGHFSQRVGMRLTYLIVSINAWFARVVYERDEWDETLVAWSSDEHAYVILIALLARGAVWITRRVLWILMMVGHVVSSFLSRQMEFDADRYQARMVGTETFTETFARVRELCLGEQGAGYDVMQSWQARRLPDNFPKLVIANVAQLSPDALVQARLVQATARTGLFDTHPADKDRIARAQRETGVPVFRLDGPATDLFRDFDSLARAVSIARYREAFGPQVTKDQLYPVAEALEGQEIEREGDEALERYFLSGLDHLQPLALPGSYPEAAAELKAAKSALVAARKAMSEAFPVARSARLTWFLEQSHWAAAETVLVVLKAGGRVAAGELGMATPTVSGAEAVARKAEEAQRAQAEVSLPFEQAACRRLTVALAMLETEAVAGRVPDGPARRDEVRALYRCATHLAGRIIPELPAVLRCNQMLANLLQQLSQDNARNNEPLVNACLRAGSRLRDALQELQWKLGDAIEYPFEHAQEGVGLARFALPLIPDARELVDLYRTAEEATGRVNVLHRRVLGRLAVTAEEVEKVLGLKPLEAPAATAQDSDP